MFFMSSFPESILERHQAVGAKMELALYDADRNAPDDFRWGTLHWGTLRLFNRWTHKALSWSPPPGIPSSHALVDTWLLMLWARILSPPWTCDITSPANHREMVFFKAGVKGYLGRRNMFLRTWFFPDTTSKMWPDSAFRPWHWNQWGKKK